MWHGWGMRGRNAAAFGIRDWNCWGWGGGFSPVWRVGGLPGRRGKSSPDLSVRHLQAPRQLILGPLVSSSSGLSRGSTVASPATHWTSKTAEGAVDPRDRPEDDETRAPGVTAEALEQDGRGLPGGRRRGQRRTSRAIRGGPAGHRDRSCLPGRAARPGGKARSGTRGSPAARHCHRARGEPGRFPWSRSCAPSP